MNAEEELLKKIRTINRLIQRSGANPLVFSDICVLCGDLLRTNVMIVTQKGKILDVFNHESQPEYPFWDFQSGNTLEAHNVTALNRVPETLEDTALTRYGLGEKYPVHSVIVPLESSGERIGTLIMCREQAEYSVSDLILVEYTATVVGTEIARAIRKENEREEQEKSACQAALASLSYSEIGAVVHIFNELKNTEGMLVASKIADRVGITRSVIVNALRKLESAGLIDSRSLGMKGTYIRVVNKALPEELKKYSKR